MRCSPPSLLLVALVTALGCTSAATVCGCYTDDCRDILQCPPLAPREEDPADTCVADPAAGRPEDRCGVFVSSSLGSDDNPGTRALPVRSMEKAIGIAQAGPLRVYACAEAFVEPVVLPSGVELWGGLDCANDWVYLGGNEKTVLAPGADLLPLRVDAGEGSSIVADVHAEAADATQPGGSSVAVMVMPSGAVEVLRSDLTAGRGAPGEKGEDGGSGPALAGTPGSSGGSACSATVVPGGAEVETTCGDLRSTGAQGGQGAVSYGSDGLTGQPEPVPNPQGFGLGGAGQTASGPSCMPGEMGAPGTFGEHGRGAAGPGRISLAGWLGQDGEDGGDGLPGQGGGGGGGRRGGAVLCGANLVRGGSGGGAGGGGGCGGKGATGGGYGGASIGLLSLSGDVALRATSIVTGDGGDGGTGGLAQAGGAGGPGGEGGNGFNWAPAGCYGGAGGHGGNGGHGGGGLGGPSIGIAHLFGSPVTQEGVTIEIGKPGQGGLGGNPAVPDSTGAEGSAGVVVPFPQ